MRYEIFSAHPELSVAVSILKTDIWRGTADIRVPVFSRTLHASRPTSFLGNSLIILHSHLQKPETSKQEAVDNQTRQPKAAERTVEPHTLQPTLRGTTQKHKLPSRVIPEAFGIPGPTSKLHTEVDSSLSDVRLPRMTEAHMEGFDCVQGCGALDGKIVRDAPLHGPGIVMLA